MFLLLYYFIAPLRLVASNSEVEKKSKHFPVNGELLSKNWKQL